MKKVIIIDDALDIARLLRSAILSLDPNLQVSVVPSGEEALLEASRDKPDLVIADVRLPGISGFDLIQRLNKRYQNVRVIVITGLSNSEVEKRAAEFRVEALLYKPMDMSVFLETVKKALENLPPPPPDLPPLNQPLPGLEGPQPARLTDILVQLRQQIEAEAIILLDERARVAALAGSLPASDFEDAWAPDLLAAASAGSRVNRLAGGVRPRFLAAWNGDEWNITLIALGTFVLAVFYASTGKQAQPLVEILDKLLATQRELEKTLGAMGISVRVPGTGPLHEQAEVKEEGILAAYSEEDPQMLEEFAALFERGAKDGGIQDVNSFWEEQAATQTTGSISSPDDLSYEQARKLGLTPDENDE
ncbi:MAG: response regulator [Anaerolineaceae bacterium]|nr:response regulator [Anaerolineaceae bacterium]